MQQAFIWLHRAAGAAIAIVVMELLAGLSGEPFVRVPFVTSIVLVMALPDSEPARPYAVIAGHVLSCAAGLAALAALGPGEKTAAVAVGLAVLAMLAARALHPPAGIDAMLVAAHGLPASWLVSPVLAGAILLVGYAALWSRLERAGVRLTARLEGGAPARDGASLASRRGTMPEACLRHDPRDPAGRRPPGPNPF